MRIGTMRSVRHITNSEVATKAAARTFMDVRACEMGEQDQNPLTDELSIAYYRNAIDIINSVNKTIDHIKMIVKRDILDHQMEDVIDVFPEGSMVHAVNQMGKATGLTIVNDVVVVTLDSGEVPLTDFVNLDGYKLHALVADEIAIAKESGDHSRDNMGEPKTLASAAVRSESRSRIAAPQ